MRRRDLLAAGAAALASAGCVAGSGGPTATKGTRSADGPTPTPARLTADGATATFRVVDGHAPTDPAVEATFEGDRVVVEGTMDPGGCREPVLADLGYGDGTVTVTVATESPYGPSPTVECGNASYDYRCVVTVDGAGPSAVAVTHDHRDDGRDRTFRRRRS